MVKNDIKTLILEDNYIKKISKNNILTYFYLLRKKKDIMELIISKTNSNSS